MRPSAISAICLLFLFSSAPAVFTETVTDGLGRTVSLQRPASRVVSLSPACTEVLFSIGAGDSVVAVTDYCDYPAEAASKPKVGGFSGKTMSIETIVSLKPDLAVVEGQMHQKVMAMLEGAGVRCYAANAARLEDSYRIIEQLGILVGRTQSASRVADAMRARIASVAAKTSKSSVRPSVFWEVWDDPLMTAGGSTFISESIGVAGGRNIFADSKEQYPTVSFESVIARNPDWILSSKDRELKMSAQALAKRQGWRALAAVRNGKVAFVDASSVSRAGPRLADAVEALARILHPELMN